MVFICRDATTADIAPVAALWHGSWQDAHAAILPKALAQARTLESFAERLSNGLSDVRIVEGAGELAGFSLIKGDELDQFFLASRAQGTGAASVLMADTDERFLRSGIDRAWLACAIGNDRAARFYEKSGWRNTGTFVSVLGLPAGPFELEVWRFEKSYRESERSDCG